MTYTFYQILKLHKGWHMSPNMFKCLCWRCEDVVILVNIKFSSNFVNIGMKCKVWFSAHIGSTQFVELDIPL